MPWLKSWTARKTEKPERDGVIQYNDASRLSSRTDALRATAQAGTGRTQAVEGGVKCLIEIRR